MPKPHLLVVGGGVDARPVVSIARELGWRVSLADPRSGHASPAHFSGATTILRQIGGELSDYLKSERVNAMIIMSHNLAIDAERWPVPNRLRWIIWHYWDRDIVLRRC